MATLKSYTDIEQSKKLAKILPLESADMYYEPSTGYCTEPSEAKFGDIKYAHPRSIRCWSLAAFLGIVCEVKRMDYSDKWEAASWNKSPTEKEYYVDVEGYDNPVDACVAIIEKLHELNLL